MKKKIYSYYESLQGFPQQEEFACANIWKASWEKHGWECVMLNASHAKNSNFYFKLTKKLVDLARLLDQGKADEYSKIAARYRRWCALHAAGGGWMSDYDVANINFPTDAADRYEVQSTILAVTGEPSYLFYASQQHCSAAIAKFLAEPLEEAGKERNEADVLNIESTLQDVLPLLFHAKKTRERSKSSELMEFVR
jgi:hypothetical protein